MRILPREATFRSLAQVLLIGFGLVILSLLAAGFFALSSIRAIQRNATTIVEQQQELGDLVAALQQEQEVLSAVFYSLGREPHRVDRATLLAELESAHHNIRDLVSLAEGTPEEEAARELMRATEEFAEEARRLLGQERASSLLSRELFERHRRVTTAVARLVSLGSQDSLAAQRAMTVESRRRLTRSMLLLGASFALALAFSVLTGRMVTGLFKRMEAQATELSRVSWRLLETQEEIARRFSHELHDELGQTLTALKAGILELARTGPGEQEARECLELVEGALRNVRELSHLLHPTILDDFGLEAGLRWLTEKFSERTGIRVELQADHAGRLPEEVELHLFRIAQEALTNVARHAEAKNVRVELRARGSEVKLSVADDGKGVESADALSRGMGMVGMRARARSVGGRLEVRSKPGQGTVVEVTIPRPEDDYVSKDKDSVSG